MEHNHDHNGGHEHHKVTTLDLLKRYLNLKIEKMQPKKKSGIDQNISPLDKMPHADISHIAIVLDGKVQDIMRAQNKMAAMLLSEPEFVLFDPAEVKIAIGFDYIDGKFVENEKD